MMHTIRALPVVGASLSIFLTLLVYAIKPSVAVSSYVLPTGGTAGSSQPICYSHWQSVGPFHVAQAYSGIGTLTDPEDIGAAHQIWVNGDTAYLATANGGVWRTTTFHTYNAFGGPHWTPVTDQMACSSIATVGGSSLDPLTVAAGCGFPSNSAQRGGEPRGVMLTQDGGNTWRMTNFPKGYWVSTVLVSGTGGSTRLIVSARQGTFPFTTAGSAADSYGLGASVGGIWLSSDAGNNFVKTNSLPITKLYQHPNISNTIYAAALVTKSAGAWPNALLKSTDGGATFPTVASAPPIASKCSITTYPNLLNSEVTYSAGGGTPILYAGFYLEDNNAVSCYALFWSSDDGASWNGISNVPTTDLGSQGLQNFAILGDPTNSGYLFVAGTGTAVFRVAAATSTWGVISSTTGMTYKVSYVRTKSTTCPHADARNFFWDAQTGELLLTNDGGVYKRTAPTDTPANGDWTSLSGDLSISEIYQHAWDATSGAIILGVQDNSVMISQFDGSEKTTGIWNFYEVADGTTVGIDSTSSPPAFHGAIQNLGSFFRFPIQGNGLSTVTRYAKTFRSGCSSGSSCFGFITVQAVNVVDNTKILICSAYDSSLNDNSICYSATFVPTQTSTTLEFSTSAYGITDSATAYVYGGFRNGVSNVNVAFVVGQSFIWARDTPCSFSGCISTYSAGSCTGGCNIGNAINKNPPWKANYVTLSMMTQHPKDYYVNLVTDDVGHNWLTADFGQTWVDLNLPSKSNLLAITGHTTVDTFYTGVSYFVPINVNGVYPLIIGTPYGSFITFSPPTSSFFTFVLLGANQAHTIPSWYSYSPINDALVVSLFGRGMWVLQSASLVICAAASGQTTTTINSACTTPLYPNVPNAYGYRSNGTNPAAIGFPIPVSSSSSSSSTGGGSSPAVASSSTASAIPSSTASGASTAAIRSSTASSIASSTASVQSSTGVGLKSSSTASISQSSSTTAATVSSTAGPAASSTASGTSKQSIVVTGLPNSVLVGSVVILNFRLPNAPSISPITFDVLISVGGATPFTYSLSFTQSNWQLPSSVTYVAPSIAGLVTVQTVLSASADSLYLPVSATFSVLVSSPTGSASSSTGSAGNPSSTGSSLSSTASISAGGGGGGGGGGGTGTAMSSTGALAPTIVPSSFPQFQLDLALTLSTLPGSTLSAFVQLLRADLAQSLGSINLERVLLTSCTSITVSNQARLRVQFAIADRWSTVESDSFTIGTNFLSLASSSLSYIYSLPVLKSTVFGTVALSADQTVGATIPRIGFTLNYDIGSLPGSTVTNFTSLVRPDIASAAGVQSRRINLLAVVAGSVKLAFAITPPLDVATSSSEIASSAAVDNFLKASKDTSSSLFKSPVTSATAVGSASVSYGATPDLGSTDSSSSSNSMVLIIIIAAAGFIVLCVIIYLSYVFCCKNKSSPPAAAAGKKGKYSPELQPGVPAHAVPEIERHGASAPPVASYEAHRPQPAKTDRRQMSLDDIHIDAGEESGAIHDPYAIALPPMSPAARVAHQEHYQQKHRSFASESSHPAPHSAVTVHLSNSQGNEKHVRSGASSSSSHQQPVAVIHHHAEGQSHEGIEATPVRPRRSIASVQDAEGEGSSQAVATSPTHAASVAVSSSASSIPGPTPSPFPEAVVPAAVSDPVIPQPASLQTQVDRRGSGSRKEAKPRRKSSGAGNNNSSSAPQVEGQ